VQGACFVGGRSVSRAHAISVAADLIGSARCPLLLFGACDVAGARAGIRLAAQVKGVVDHIESEGALRELEVMRSFGKFIVTPSEARQRADTVLVVGSGLTRLWPEIADLLGLAELPPLALRPQRRHILWIGGGQDDEPFASLATQTVGAEAAAFPGLIAALRASLAKRRIVIAEEQAAALNAMAESLQRAQFGVVIYSPSSLDALAIEMLVGLVVDLNKATRFSTISIGGSGTGETLTQTAGWTTGFPVRTGFGRGFPEHDPWRFDAARLIASEEADALVWITGDATDLPSWAAHVPSVSLSPARLDTAKVSIEIGTHGRDHDCVEFARDIQALAWRRATHPSDRSSVAATLDDIAASLSREAA
jgi:formylmethanofuran dehydrogenase subunit B